MKISYLSDTDPDYSSLEQHLKAGGFGELSDQWLHEAQQNLASLENVFNRVADNMPWLTPEVREQLVKVEDVTLPTRFDSPLHFRILDGLISRIREAARSIGLDITSFPHYSCIPTGQVNASAVKLPHAQRSFLLFDSQLFIYCNLFAKAFAQCLPVTGRGENISYSTDIDLVRRRLKSKPIVTKRLAEVLFAYATTGYPGHAGQYNPEKDYMPLVQTLRDGMELFVVGHEFGHVYAGHLSEILRRFGIVSENLPLESVSHVQEHEADCLGLLLTLKAMSEQGYDASLSFIGIEMFFVSLELAARARHFINDGTDETYVDLPSESHPSNSRRREVISETLELFSTAEQVEEMRAIASHYGAIATLLWQSVMRVFHTSRRSRRSRRRTS